MRRPAGQAGEQTDGQTNGQTNGRTERRADKGDGQIGERCRGHLTTWSTFEQYWPATSVAEELEGLPKGRQRQ